MCKVSTVPLIARLIEYLNTRPANGRFQDWTIQQISGGANNLLYRVTNQETDWAVKFTIQDARRRAVREYNALLALQQARLTIAPMPIWLDESRSVVVQSWVAGTVTADPPQTESEWEHLVRHYATIHTLEPQNTQVAIEPAVLNFSSIPSAYAGIQAHLAAIPPQHRPSILQKLLPRLLAQAPTALPPCPLALCRVDANLLNFLRRPDGWYSVDWENSGWGDPAFEITDVMCHPRYESVSDEQWEWVAALYGQISRDKTAVSRIYAYYPFMLVWWVAKFGRMLYEIPRGKDERLVTRPTNWQTDLENKLERYTQKAARVIK